MTEHTSTNEGPPRVARYVDETTPENQAETFRNQDQVWPVRAIRRGDAVRPLPPHARPLDGPQLRGGRRAPQRRPTSWPATAPPGCWC